MEPNMLFAGFSLCVYSLILLFISLMELASFQNTFWLARFIVLSSMVFGVGSAAFHQHRQGFFYRSVGEMTSEDLKHKSLAIRLCLLVLLLFSVVMEYSFSSWSANPFNPDFLVMLPVLLLLTPWYVRWAEAAMPSGCDGYARLGQVILGKRSWRWHEQKQLLLAWLVKLFFIPLMYSWLMIATENLLLFNWSMSPGSIIEGLFNYGLAADLLIATTGYIFASRLLSNQVISTDNTWSGWLVCLLCYPPLFSIFQAVKQQTNDLVWTNWLQPDQVLYWFWAAAVTSTWLVYWLSTLHFGLRFANLSWRGLIDTGPYRFVKHPAYLSKNLYWWLYLVPFYGVTSGYELWRNLLGLTFVSLVYYLRAYTEERHLMQFPEYRDYADRIRQNGLVSRCKRVLIKAKSHAVG